MANNVLVIATRRSPDSQEIANAYAKAYNLPAKQICILDCLPGEEVKLVDFRKTIQRPLYDYLKQNHLETQIDYFVLTKGIPIRIQQGRFSVDSALMAVPLQLPFAKEAGSWHKNPYYGSIQPFSRKKYGFYLATRLDGYIVNHAKELIDNSRKAKRANGIFLLDLDPRRDKEGYAAINESMREASKLLKQRHYEVVLDTGNDFIGGERDLMGYYSWGSNDGNFSAFLYRSLRFRPGAIAETAVSTSARTFNRTNEGQSLIADLIEHGVTGVKGYVSEPFTPALCRAHILFDRYTQGRNLAESFWAATPFIQWKDLVIGDPLCAPYEKS
jgi:uncharacterized protein (TIGR03790 family)